MDGQSGEFADTEARARLVEGATPELVRQAELVLNQLAKIERQLAEGGGGTTVINHNQHSRNTYPDARARQRATRNGQRLVRDAMEG